MKYGVHGGIEMADGYDLITDAETDPGTTFRSLKWKGKGDTILHLSK